MSDPEPSQSTSDPEVTQNLGQAPVMMNPAPVISLEALVQALASHVQPVRPKSLKLADPPKFHGKLTESSQFVHAVLANVQSDTRYDTVQKKILYFSSWLEGSPHKWFFALLRRNANAYLEQENLKRSQANATMTAGGTLLPMLVFDNHFQFDSELYPFVLPELVDWREFLRKFNLSYADPDARATAERKLKLLDQKNKSVAAYAAEYQSYCYELDDTPARVAQNFYSGLKKEIKDRVADHGKPHTLEDMIALAVTFENRLAERDFEKKEEEAIEKLRESRKREAAQKTKPPISGRLPNQANLRTSQIAAASPTPTSFKRGKLTVEERQYRFDNGLCIYCGQRGHFTKDHPGLAERNIASTSPTAPSKPDQTDLGKSPL